MQLTICQKTMSATCVVVVLNECQQNLDSLQSTTMFLVCFKSRCCLVCHDRKHHETRKMMTLFLSASDFLPSLMIRHVSGRQKKLISLSSPLTNTGELPGQDYYRKKHLENELSKQHYI